MLNLTTISHSPVCVNVSSFCDFLRFASTTETDIIPVALANAQNSILPLPFFASATVCRGYSLLWAWQGPGFRDIVHENVDSNLDLSVNVSQCNHISKDSCNLHLFVVECCLIMETSAIGTSLLDQSRKNVHNIWRMYRSTSSCFLP